MIKSCSHRRWNHPKGRRRARLALAACLVFAGAALAADEIEYRTPEGKTAAVRGNIREETPREVVIQAASGEVRVPVPQIEAVRYDKQPAALINVRSKERQGRYAEAAEDYREIGKDIPETQDRLRSAIAFDVFRCLAEQAVADPTKASQATGWYERFSESFRGTRFFYPMQELIGRVLLSAGEPAKARGAFATLAEVDAPGVKEKARVYEGLCALREGKPDEAAALFRQAAESTDESPLALREKLKARVLLAESRIQAGAAAEAEKNLRELLAQIPVEASETKAMAHNALGDALRAQKKPPKESILDGYMWTMIVYNQNPESLAKALFHLSQLFGELGQTDRAEQAASRLKSEFPGSPWTKMLEGS